MLLFCEIVLDHLALHWAFSSSGNTDIRKSAERRQMPKRPEQRSINFERGKWRAWTEICSGHLSYTGPSQRSRQLYNVVRAS